MNRTLRTFSALVFGGALLIAIGCGSSSDGSSGTSNGSSSSGTTQSFTCCINGQNYTCPSESAVTACGNGDGSQCTATTMNADGMCS